MNRAGIGRNFHSIPHVENQLGQGNGFRGDHQKTVAPEKIIQAFPAKLSCRGLSVAAAGKKDFIGDLPLWIDGNIPRNGIEYFQELWGIEGGALEGDLRDNDAAIGGRHADDFKLIPNAQQLQKF